MRSKLYARYKESMFQFWTFAVVIISNILSIGVYGFDLYPLGGLLIGVIGISLVLYLPSKEEIK